MPSQTFKYVVLGAGNAAGYAAREFVANGLGKGELVLIGDEPTLPYERPALSKAVLTNDAVRLPGFHTCVGSGGERQNQDFYDTHGITVLSGKRVVSLDAKTKTCTLAGDGGDTVVAEKALILATGADAFRLSMLPGSDLDGVVYLRNNADALDLADRLKACKGKKVVVVGGGYIGCEVAAAAVAVGCETTMVFPEASIMPRLFTPELGKHYEDAFKEMGVTLLHNGRVCKEFLGDGGKVRAVRACKDSDEMEVEAELVIVGVGARPATAIFKDVLDVDKAGGVVVDGNFKSSVEGVYAVGDIATFPLKRYNRESRVEHVGHARSSAAHAVRDICGVTQETYDYLPFFYSRAGATISWKFYGDNVGDCVVLGDRASKLAAFWVGEDGKVVGAFCEQPTDEESDMLKKIATEQPAVAASELSSAGSAAAAFELLAAK